MKKLIGIGACLMLAASLSTGCSSNSSQTEVTTAIAKSGRDLSSMVWQGTVEALSTIDIMPEANGKVTEVNASEGQHVEKGDVIFQVDDTNAALSLQQAQAGYDAAQAAFNIAKKASEQNTNVAPAEIEYTDAKNNFARMQALYAANAISQVDLETAKSRMNSAEAKLQAARNGQDGNYDSAKAQMDSAKAALHIARKKYDDCTVTSPIAGMITKINVETGQTVSPQLTGATVMDDSGEKVEIQVADTDIGQLAEGMPMDVSLQSAGKTCSGSISEISAVCDAKTGMYTVKIRLDDKDSLHYTGLMADVRASVNEPSASVYIPSKCIFSDDNGDYVYVVSGNQAAKMPVTKGRKKNAYMEITQGLTQGNEVILQSSQSLEDGMKVRVLTVK